MEHKKVKLTPEEIKEKKEQNRERLEKLWNQNKAFVEIKRVIIILISTIIYGIGISWFINGLDPVIHSFSLNEAQEIITSSNYITIYTGGVAGVGQVFYDLFALSFDYADSLNRSHFISIFVFIGNIPLLVLGWFGVSKRFTIYSVISVVAQSLIIGLIPIVPTGLNQEPFISAVIGGLLIGAGTGLALRFGTSTGGFDILSQYLALKKGVSFGIFSLGINLAVCFLGAVILGFANGSIAAAMAAMSYTIIRLIVSTIMIDRVHTGYNYQSITIITTKKDEVVEALLHKIKRGVTLIDVVGAYTQLQKTMIYVVISSYELHNILEVMKKIDGSAFITSTPVKSIHGMFARKTIA